METQKPACAVELTEDARARLCLILGAINWTAILFSVTLVGIGGYIKLKVEEFTHLIKDYDCDSMTYLLLGVGLASLLSNILGGWLTFGSADPERRRQYRHFLLAHIIFTLVISVVIAASGILCFMHISNITNSFKGGLGQAMKVYRTNITIKAEVDKLQMEFNCCGNKEYADWFIIPWLDPTYLDTTKLTKDKNNEYTVDSVPFSCCSPSAVRPCIHHNVQDNLKHYNYDWSKDLTINKIGCLAALKDFVEDELFIPCGGLILGIFLLNVIIAVASRFLHTALNDSVLAADPTAPTYGYLFANDLGPHAGPEGEPLLPAEGMYAAPGIEDPYLAEDPYGDVAQHYSSTQFVQDASDTSGMALAGPPPPAPPPPPFPRP